MTYKPKHLKSIPGDPAPSDIFKPHRLSVELFEDMDKFFQEARENASGENDNEETRTWKKFEGQRAVAIVTPGRLVMLDPCPEPNSMLEEKVAPMRQLMMTNPTDREWLSKTISFSFEREKLSADSVIDKLLKSGGWSWATPLKKTGALKLPLTMSDGSTRHMRFGLTLKKDPQGRRQLEIER